MRRLGGCGQLQMALGRAPALRSRAKTPLTTFRERDAGFKIRVNAGLTIRGQDKNEKGTKHPSFSAALPVVRYHFALSH